MDESERERVGHVDEPGGVKTPRNERSNERRGYVDEPIRHRIGYVDESSGPATPRSIELGEPPLEYIVLEDIESFD